jgi:hypothetical protein
LKLKLFNKVAKRVKDIPNINNENVDPTNNSVLISMFRLKPNEKEATCFFALKADKD